MTVDHKMCHEFRELNIYHVAATWKVNCFKVYLPSFGQLGAKNVHVGYFKHVARKLWEKAFVIHVKKLINNAGYDGTIALILLLYFSVLQVELQLKIFYN